jgi:WD40 repeat protein
MRRFQGHSDWVMSVAVTGDGQTAISASKDTSLVLWRVEPYPGGLLRWTQNFRYAPELSCEQREVYRVLPYCDAEGVAPTRTPFPTLAPTSAP